ncbi:putative ribonuclease H-like domain-containing protein [Tanacetum coccineum]
MDVKSAFLYGTIEEDVYVTQPPGFKDPDHPDKIYKVVKALYGLHQAPRAWYETLANYLLGNRFKRGKIDQTLFIKKQKGDILLVQVYVDDIIFGSRNKELCTAFKKLMNDNQDKYVAEILKKFNYTDVKSASTLVDLEKPLVKDGDADDVDVHLYRSMIRSLMYLTTSRPDIMFAVCACAIFQVTPKTSHLLAIKRIFRYLKDLLTKGFDAGRFSTWSQVLECLILNVYISLCLCKSFNKGFNIWMKGQDNPLIPNPHPHLLNSTIKKPFIVPSSYPPKNIHKPRKAIRTTKISQSNGPINLVAYETVYKEREDRMERDATTASSLDAEQDNGNINKTQSIATLNESNP